MLLLPLARHHLAALRRAWPNTPTATVPGGGLYSEGMWTPTSPTHPPHCHPSLLLVPGGGVTGGGHGGHLLRAAAAGLALRLPAHPGPQGECGGECACSIPVAGGFRLAGWPACALHSPTPNPTHPTANRQVLKRNEYQAILEQFNRRMGRTLVSSSGTAGTSAGTQGSLGGGSSSTLLPPRSPAPSFNLPQIARLNSGGAASQVGAKASAAAQNVAARLSGPNLTAAKASAAAAGESMRDSMRETMRAMKNKSLRFMQRDAS